jgi:uncharacterized RDD family membrane protein YckC
MVARRDDTLNLIGHYAGVASRFLALLIDAAIISLSVSAITLTVASMRSLIDLVLQLEVANQLGFVTTIAQTVARPAPIVATLLSAGFFVAYHVFFLAAAGRTPGKAFMGLRVLTTGGGKLTVFRAFLRLVGYLVSAVPLFGGFIWVLVDDQRQGFHDKIGQTYVVYAWAARPDETFLVREMTRLFPQKKT